MTVIHLSTTTPAEPTTERRLTKQKNVDVEGDSSASPERISESTTSDVSTRIAMVNLYSEWNVGTLTSLSYLAAKNQYCIKGAEPIQHPQWCFRLLQSRRDGWYYGTIGMWQDNISRPSNWTEKNWNH